ncbi:hypothetical protein ABKN59_003424 [Abortiporus biennis]
MSTISTNMTSPTEPRNIVLCFDGTGNKFGQENSNVVRFFRALQKDGPRQIIYYQPGIGTYNKRQFFTRTFSTLASYLDQAVALHLNDHVKEGYKFLMDNYKKGDKICLFGFSRGAYTARVLAAMLYKVGLLPPGNHEQVDFAFSVYQTTGQEGVELSREFKKTFALPVTVEFLGVWDTVSSVGLIPRSHPYTSVNYSVKTFRHALALDERRTRFRPNLWHEPTLIPGEQDLDVDDPESLLKPIDDKNRDAWVYQPPNRMDADVLEVWFAGAHADVGGGSHTNAELDSLSFIPLRWMIKECYDTNTGILFRPEILKSYGFDVSKVPNAMTSIRSQSSETPSPMIDTETFSPGPFSPTLSDITMTSSVFPVSDQPAYFQLAHDFMKTHIGFGEAIVRPKEAADTLAQIFDQLVLQPWWHILEVIPTLTTQQLDNGTWVRYRAQNLGVGRYVPKNLDGKVNIHTSVKTRLGQKRGDSTYTPMARNWNDLMEREKVSPGLINWVE